MKRFLVLAFVVITALDALSVQAQVHDDVSDVIRARVTDVYETEMRVIPGTDTEHTFQTVEAQLLEGGRTGDRVTVQNDFLELEVGDRFFAIHYVMVDGTEVFSVQDVDRRGPLALLVLFFVAVVVVFGGWYGARALLSLIGSLIVIGYILVPGLLGGWNPLVASFVVAGLILAGALSITHGFNRESAIAIGGTLVAVAATLLLAAWSVDWLSLSGFAGSESVSLNYSTSGALDLAALLIGGIVIGAIGVLDDIAITQVAIVRELYASSSTMSAREVFVRAMQVGREHVGAVVNTLALAYVGVALPLVLFMAITPVRTSMVLNLELFATEIARIVVGSIGIVLTVPLVTYFAVRFLPRTTTQGDVEAQAQTMIHSHKH